MESYAAAVPLLEQARAVARSCGARALEVIAEAMLGLCLAFGGEPDRGLDFTAAAFAEALTGDDDEALAWAALTTPLCC